MVHYLDIKTDEPVGAGGTALAVSDPAPVQLTVVAVEVFGSGFDVEDCGGRVVEAGKRAEFYVTNVKDYPKVFRGRLVCEEAE